MDGGSADHAGAVICRPPWMAGVQITQERLSAALRAITVFVLRHKIAREAGSYSVLFRTVASTRDL